LTLKRSDQQQNKHDGGGRRGRGKDRKEGKKEKQRKVDE